MKSFGLLLREFRNKSIDPKTGKRLSQEKLAVLMGEILGTTYTSQAISDWERDKSQIHKDHRQVLCALIQALHQCGGLGSLEDAERLLIAGNYRGLSHTEAETIFLSPPPAAQAPFSNAILEKLTHQENLVTPITMLKAVSIILCWLVTWLAIAPSLDFSNSNIGQLLRVDITLVLSSLAVPAILAWLIKLDANEPPTMPMRFLNFCGAILGYALGIINILTIAILSYNLYLYPWPTIIVLIVCVWPVALSIVSAKLFHSHYQATHTIIRFRDLKCQWAIMGIPPILGLAFYYLYPLCTTRIWGPLLLILLSTGLGILFWVHTRKTR